MTDQDKTKAQLIAELEALRQQVAQLQETDISQIVEPLKQKQQLLHDMIDAIPAIIFAKDVDGRLMLVNQAFDNFFQVKPGALIGQIDYDYFPKEKATKIRQDDLRAMAADSPLEYDEEIPLVNGGVATFHTIKFPLYNKAGEVYGMGGIATDITENKLVQQALQESEKRFREIVEGTGDLITRVDAEGKFTYVNQTARRIFGLSEEECIGQSIYDYIYPDDIERTQQAFAGWVANKETHIFFENRQINHKTGEVFDMLWNVNLYYDEEGELLIAASIARDITALKEAKDEVEENQKLLQKIIDAIPMRIFWKDTELNFLGCNLVFVQDGGLETPDQIIGKNDFDMAWADYAEQYRADDKAVLESGRSRLNYEEPFVAKDGSQAVVRTSKVVLRDMDDNIYGILGLFEDITEIKKAQQEQKRLQQKVIDAQRQVIQELSVPIIPLMDEIIVLPLIGDLDALRAKNLLRTILSGISQHRAKIVIIDITGVSIVDTSIAAYLDKTIQAARLKGARTVITGMSDAVAETLIDLGVNWSNVETLRDLQTGLRVALQWLGVKLN